MQSNWNSHSLLVVMQMVQTLWEKNWQFFYKVKHILNTQSSNSTASYLHKGTGNFCSHKNLYTNVNNWKQPKRSLAGEYISKPQYIQILEYYSEWSKREQITGSCDMDEAQMPCAK